MEGQPVSVNHAAEPADGASCRTTDSLGPDAIEALVEEMSELWGHLNAATCRFLELVAVFDRAEGWGYEGCASCAHWLNLKCGIGAVAAREKVRIARALEMLPKIADAFRRGRISYSKVRAMTRVATADNEELLLQVALYGTAAHVEKLVRYYRRVERLEDAEEALERHRSRFLRMYYDDDGMLVLHARLPAEVGALVEQAIEAAMQTLEAPDDGALVDAPADVSAEAFSAHDGRFSGAEDSGESGAAGDPSHSRGSDGPTDSCDSADSEVDVHDPIGARRADGLEDLARCFLAAEAERRPSSVPRYQVVVRIDQSVLSQTPSAGADRERICEIEDGPVLAMETARRLACDSALLGLVHDADGEPLAVGRRTRAIPTALQRALKDRDGGCRFPGCDRRRYTEGHHIRHWADGGETTLENLITLCHFHHRLLHEGGFGLRVTDDGAFVFTRPDGQRVTPGSVPADRCFTGNIAGLNERRDVSIRRPPGWHGERMNYGLPIEAMLEARDSAVGPKPGLAVRD